MNRIRQHLRRRSSSSNASTTPLHSHSPLSPTLSAADKRKKSSEPVLRRLYIISDTPVFDPRILHRFQAEGFEVEYIYFPGNQEDPDRDRKDLEKVVHEREDDLEAGERYAVVAYNTPAYHLLTSHHQSLSTTNPFPRLCALVTYYPQSPSAPFAMTPDSNASHPLPSSTTSTATPTLYTNTNVSLLPIQIHLAGQCHPLWQEYSTSTHPLKKRHTCHLFFYPESDAGFAESTVAAYDGISARLAWSRALECLKRGFGWPGGCWDRPEVEAVWEGWWENLLSGTGTGTGCNDGEGEDVDTQEQKQEQEEEERGEERAANAVKMMVGGSTDLPINGQGSGSGSAIEDPGPDPDPAMDPDEKPDVNCVPTMIGGTSPAQLATFYTSQFIPTGPPSQSIRLLSRTTGPDRVVDELLLSFTHTEEIPWLLPNVPPTGKSVRIVLVMSASFVAGRLARHNIYWDQASVLVQVGLLDPGLIPGCFNATGKNRKGEERVTRIPVVGSEGVERVLSG